MSRSAIKILLKYGVGIAIIAAMVWWKWNGKDGEPGLSVIVERPLNYKMLALSVAICAIGTAITFVRWYVLIVAQGLPVSPRDVVRLSLLGYFFNTFLPGSVGGDLVKAAFLVREQSRRTLAVATVAFDRIIGLMGLFWLVALLGGTLYLSGTFDSFLTDPKASYTLRGILIASAAIAAGTIVAWMALGWLSPAWLDRLELRLDNRSKLGHSLAELVRAVRTYRQKGRAVALALAMSIVGFFCFVVSWYCGALVVNDAKSIPSFEANLVVVPVGMAIRGVVPLPGGIGGAELSYGLLYEWVGASFAAGMLGSLAELAVKFLLGGVALAIYGVMDKKRDTPEGGEDAG